MSKNRVRIIADSTCDLPEELIRKYDIGIVPLHITLGNVSCDDGVDVTPSEIYAWSKKNDAVPKTSPCQNS